jgi:hypothetical protein
MIIYIVILILVILIFYTLHSRQEGFETNNEQPKLENETIKRVCFKYSNNYKLVFKTNKFCVWECIPMNEYFPIGQIITTTKEPPAFSDILVDGNQLETRPSRYDLISSTRDGMKVWRPVVPKGYGVVSYIFSKTKPSLNRIKILPFEILKRTVPEELLLKTSRYNIWSLHDSNYYYVSDAINNKIKENITFYRPNLKYFEPSNKLLLSKTSSFKKIYNDKKISIWRPLPSKNYRSLGDCIFPGSFDPNGKKSVDIAHKSFCYPIIDYYDEPICTMGKLSVWKPQCPVGYGIMGHVVSFDKKEPRSNEVYSIPLEYLVENKNVINMKNAILENRGNYTIWNNDNYCFGTPNLKKPDSCLKLNKNYTKYEKTVTELPHEVSMGFESLNEDFELDEKLTAEIQKTLSQRTGASEFRFSEFKVVDNNIHYTIDSKPINSQEDTIEEIIELLNDILKRKPISVNDDLKLLNISSNQYIEKEKIIIDNNDFVDKLN